MTVFLRPPKKQQHESHPVSFNLSLKKKKYLLYCVFVFGEGCAMAYMEVRDEPESVLFHHVVLRDLTQAVRHGGKHLYLWGHFSSSFNLFSWMWDFKAKTPHCEA